MKHNKKRNTAFLYECLMKELTKAIVREEATKKQQTLSILKEFFHKNSLLRNDLELYNSILESKKMPVRFAQRFIFETKKDFNNLDRKEIFNKQTVLIKRIHETLSTTAFANFISNYKDMASVGVFLNSPLKAKSRIILEGKIIKMLTSDKTETVEMKHVDNLTYRTFVDKFNNAYAKSLRKEQKDLLMNYIISFSDNGLGLKSFLNEEISRLKKEVDNLSLNEKIAKNEAFLAKTKQVLNKLETYSKVPITEDIVKDIFYIQDLVLEVNS